MNVYGIKFGKRGNSSGEVPNTPVPGVNILPPYGTKFPVVLSPTTASTDLTKRLVGANPFDGFWLTLPAKLRPQQILNILRSAQGGDVWQLAQLHDLALTMWPMYKKCVEELKEAVTSVKFDVHPYAEEGQEPTQKAKDKADLVRRAFRSLCPTPYNDEQDFRGLVHHLIDIPFLGVGMMEIIWDEVEDNGFGYEQLPRATTYVHPRHFTYTQDGFLTVFDENYNRYAFNPGNNAVYAPDADRFICAQYYSHGGSPLSSALLRPLGIWLSIIIFNREWTFNNAQKHGSPFMDLTYKPGTQQGEIDKLNEFAAKAASQGYVVHVEGTTVTVHPVQGAAAKDNPQIFLSEEGDKQCQLLILGQTLTSDMPASGAGSYAASKTHAGVRQDKIEAYAKWVAGNPLKQFARAILRVNYNGDEKECPVITPDFSKPLEATERSTLITAINGVGIPLLAEECYKLLGFGSPEQGDKVLINGKLGELGPVDDELSAIHLPGVEEIDQELEMADALAKIQTKNAPKDKPGTKAKKKTLRAILAEASPEDIEELKALVIKAKEAPHQNGELKAVEVKIVDITNKTRFKV